MSTNKKATGSQPRRSKHPHALATVLASIHEAFASFPQFQGFATLR